MVQLLTRWNCCTIFYCCNSASINTESLVGNFSSTSQLRQSTVSLLSSLAELEVVLSFVVK